MRVTWCSCHSPDGFPFSRAGATCDEAISTGGGMICGGVMGGSGVAMEAMQA